MARSWLISGRGIARKVKNANRFSDYQIKELGIEARRECPNCNHVIDNSDVSVEWPGLPAGVKFDPTDVELLEHLAGKVGLSNAKAHMFIDEFIPTLEEDQGICYTHPENLSGVRKDGSSVHFFHRISNAYATGSRKRRKICGESNSRTEERVRWHKTGKTKPVMDNGIQKGWKKIMVLYRSLKKGCKPDKADWVMHQYHLGADEEERDGELVVSKIFYQHNIKQDRGEAEQGNDDPNALATGTGPRTPKTVTPEPPHLDKRSPLSEAQEYSPQAFIQKEPHSDVEMLQLGGQQSEIESRKSVGQHNDGASSLWLAGESQGVEELDSLLCHEVLDNFAPTDGPSMRLNCADLVDEKNDMLDRNFNASCLFPELDNIPIDTPPDYQLADLQFGSQDSISSWLDRL